MQLVETAVLGASHEDATLRGADDGGHFDVCRDGHVGGIHADLLAAGLGERGSGEADEEDGDGGAQDHDGGYLVDEHVGLWLDDGDMGDDVWLVDKGADVLAVGGEALRWRGGTDGPVDVVPEEELVVDGYPHALYRGEEAHVGRDARGWRGVSGGERGKRDALL
jgi:hypothetical protein